MNTMIGTLTEWQLTVLIFFKLLSKFAQLLDDTHKATASTASGGHTKKQPQHSTGSTLATSDSHSRTSQPPRTTNQQAITTTTPKANIAQPTTPRQNQTTQQQLSSSTAPQRYPVNESNETSPTSRPVSLTKLNTP